MTSTFKKTYVSDELYNHVVDYLRDGIVLVEYEELTYLNSTSEYSLNNGNIIDIISIEGINNDGFYVPPDGTYNGISALDLDVDFTLTYSGVETTDKNGNILYDKLNFINNNTFENNSKIYISYRYYDANKVTNITNFETGSVAGMFARNIANMLEQVYQINNRTYEAGFLSLATGQDLDNHADGWGLTRNTGTLASGVARVSIAASGTDLTVNNNFAFVSAVSGEELIFRPIGVVDGSSFTVPAGGSSDFIVQATQVGAKYNIGANTITELYRSSALTDEVTEDTSITVINPVLNTDGTVNSFTGGTDLENDLDLRNRIYRTANKLGRSSLPAMIAALEDLDFVSNAKIIDYETNPELDADTFYVYAVGNSGLKLLTDATSKSRLRSEINEYRPIGTQFSILSPMGSFIEFSGTVTLRQDDNNVINDVINEVQTNITNYINNLKIGEDVIYSEIIEQAMIVAGVYKFDIDKLNYTEFANNPYAFDNISQKIIDNTTGTPDIDWYRQEFKFLPSFRSEAKLYEGNSTFTMTHSDIINSPTPYVLLAIDDGNGNYIRDPSYATNWYDSNSDTTITINTTAGAGVSRTLVQDVDYLNFYYETETTKEIDKIRVRLSNNYSGTESGTVALFVYSGAGTAATLVDSGTINVTAGVQDYSVALTGGSLTVSSPQTETYYAILSGVSTPSGTYISLPVSQSGTAGNLSTFLYQGDAGTNYNSGTLIANVTPLLHTVIETSGTADVPIENKAQTPDVAVVYDIDIGYNLISED